MTKIVRFLCAVGLLATMLGSPALWSQDDTEKLASKAQEAPKVEASKVENGLDQSTKNKPPAAAKTPAGDFKPSEEISEDFPVPLPSDI